MAATIPTNQRPQTVRPALETPTHGKGGSWSITCSTTISAPLKTVLSTLLDTRTYSSWNPFCPQTSITKQPQTQPQQPPPQCLQGSDILALDTTVQKGTEMTLEIHLDGSNNDNIQHTQVVVSVLDQMDLDQGSVVRVAWRTNSGGYMPGFMLRAERVQELRETSSDGQQVVEYRCWETFYGWLAPAVDIYVGKKLLWGFGAWMDGLKEYSEKQAQEN